LKKGNRRNRKKVKPTRLENSRGVAFVPFQQAIIREKLASGVVPAEQLTAIHTYIEETYTQELKALDRPWMSLLTEGQTERDREKEYYEQ
jgi:hypothetical protein